MKFTGNDDSGPKTEDSTLVMFGISGGTLTFDCPEITDQGALI